MGVTTERHPIVTDRAPRPLAGAPYSQGIASRGLVFCSGQIPMDPTTQEMVTGPVAAQTERVLENLKGVLEAAGSSLADVLKTTVFLTNLDDFAEMNSVYAKYFPNLPPARSTIEVSKLPGGAHVEIEAIAAGE